MKRIDWKALEQFERDNVERICRQFFPNGKKVGQEWKLGDTSGAAGDSLGVALAGDKRGVWHDRATSEGGKLRNLIAAKGGISDQAAVEEIERAFAVTFHENGSQNSPSFDWTACVMAMDGSDTLRELEDWRGLSREFCARLVAKRLLGLYNGSIAFPIHDQAGNVSWLHYLANREEKLWLCSKGAVVSALVIGNLKEAVEVHIFESTWDGLAFCDRAEAWRSANVCTIITRGVDHAKKVHGVIPAGKRVYVWPQNDKVNAKGIIPSERWFEGIKETLEGQFYRVQTPSEFEDLNAWTLSGASKADLLDAMDGAQLVGEPPKVYIEFLKPSQIKAYQPPPGTLLVGDHHIVRGSVFVLGGPPGVGKSRSSVALAEGGATKLDWLGLKVHCNFKTLIVQNENGRYRLKLEFADLDEKLLDKYLRISPPPPFGLRFDKLEFRDQLKQAMDVDPPGVIVLDPWNAVSRDDKAKDYRESFDLIRDVIPAGDDGPAIGIMAHTRKPQPNERTNGRALLNLLAGSYVLASVPRTAWILQHATDDVAETRVVVTCCKNNDGDLGPRSVWTRDNGLWTQVHDFDWEAWDNPDAEPKEKGITETTMAAIFDNGANVLVMSEAVEALMSLTGFKKSACYKSLDHKGRFKAHLHYSPSSKKLRWIP